MGAVDHWTTNVQWKGTDLCMDFNCPACGGYTHFDGMFAHNIQCSACGAVFEMPTDLPLQRVAPDDVAGRQILTGEGD